MMKATTKQISCFALLLTLALAGTFLAVPPQAVSGMNAAAPNLQSAAKPVVGTYAGSVIITEPFPLGTLNLVFSISGESNALEGRVIPGKTQVFLGAPSFVGSISATAGMTPTIRLDSEPFTDLISGRAVQRRFSLTGVVGKNSDVLTGTYRETIEGFKPQPMEIVGTFSLARPVGAELIIDVPPTPTPTPIPTATATLAPGQPTPTRTPIGTTPTIPTVSRAMNRARTSPIINSRARNSTPVGCTTSRRVTMMQVLVIL